MKGESLYPRFTRRCLEEALVDTPVALIYGPRQSGKTTLARMVGDEAGYTYVSFDDAVTFAAARADPIGFMGDLPDRAVLDEVQRVPEIFSVIKTLVDRGRTPGRFIMTGSANVLLVPKLSDSLAGRIDILRLHPLSQCEIARNDSKFFNSLFSGKFKMRRYDRLGLLLAERIVSGGYPAALARATPRRRMAWYRDYIATLVQRDVRDLARISALDALPRLLQLVAGQTAKLINIAGLASPFQLSRPTIRDYVILLERVFLVDSLPSWHSNRLSRLIKTPKMHIGDTGLASALLGLDAQAVYKDRALFGQLLETFVFQELRRQAGWQEEPIGFYHFRDKEGAEVDIVLERGAGQLVGVEIKAAATVTIRDFSGLKKLKAAARERFVTGVVLYDGESAVSFGEHLFAIPIRALWERVSRF